MSVKIRLARHGRRKAPYYRLVVADSRVQRDGRFIEILGIYQPLNKKPEDQVRVNEEKTMQWLERGAIPSDTCRSILRKQGIMKRFHESRLAARKAQGTTPPAVEIAESAPPAAQATESPSPETPAAE